ncbi:hypothetical protein BLNAU_19474 [Blattamonas nauphoetae]|uniref:Uncharacterized protein n=1 Tax=Blattamonas nauphoetae TaxID=2049346 RepID=A0ABQ9X1H7_9EUKA|nr:hypothetical protein BLNAU_19474 [Blattamonas nauphoetae]
MFFRHITWLLLMFSGVLCDGSGSARSFADVLRERGLSTHSPPRPVPSTPLNTTTISSHVPLSTFQQQIFTGSVHDPEDDEELPNPDESPSVRIIQTTPLLRPNGDAPGSVFEDDTLEDQNYVIDSTYRFPDTRIFTKEVVRVEYESNNHSTTGQPPKAIEERIQRRGYDTSQDNQEIVSEPNIQAPTRIPDKYPEDPPPLEEFAPLPRFSAPVFRPRLPSKSVSRGGSREEVTPPTYHTTPPNSWSSTTYPGF